MITFDHCVKHAVSFSLFILRNNVVLSVALTSWILLKWRRMYAVLRLVKR